MTRGLCWYPARCSAWSTTSNAAMHGWHTPSIYGFLAAGAALGVVFAPWQGRAVHPLLPSRVVLDRNRGGAYLSMLIAASGLLGILPVPDPLSAAAGGRSGGSDQHANRWNQVISAHLDGDYFGRI